jgi:hypothetical protein
MTDDIRPDVLDRVRAEYVDLAARMQHDVLRMLDDLELTRAERLRVAVELAGAALGELHDVGALKEPRGLLDMNRNQVDALVTRGLGLFWLMDQLVNWTSRPELPLVDVLKVEPPARVAYMARELRKAGIHDLDELSPPDLLTNDAEVDDG